MSGIRLFVNWLLILLSPVWICPCFLVYLYVELRDGERDTQQIFLTGKRWLWGGP